MMTAPKLFLDMDGVIADFDGALAARGHYALGDFYVRKDPKDWTPEELAHSNDTDKAMQDLSFWEAMKPFRGARPFYDALLRLWPGKVVILTALPNNAIAAEIADIKKHWAWRHLGVWHCDTITTQRHLKRSFAVGGGLLVDDLEKNCQEFRAAGGGALLHTDFTSTLAGIRSFINA